MLEPKIIICEGASAFEGVVKISSCNAEWQDGISYAFAGNQHIIGYTRTYSHIRNIDSVAKKIKDIMKKGIIELADKIN